MGEIAQVARQVNAANGWGVDFEYDHVPGYIALIHSEIVEARRERLVTPRNRELGDVLVRALDLAELLAPGALAAGNWDPGEPKTGFLGDRLHDLHAHATDALEAYRKRDEAQAREVILGHLQLLVLDTVDLIHEYGGHARHILAEIVQANSLRGHRHGGRRT